jgi:hypothetical protein
MAAALAPPCVDSRGKRIPGILVLSALPAKPAGIFDMPMETPYIRTEIIFGKKTGTRWCENGIPFSLLKPYQQNPLLSNPRRPLRDRPVRSGKKARFTGPAR